MSRAVLGVLVGLALSIHGQEVDRGLDLVFVVDDSASIEAPNFQKQKDFLNKLVDPLEIGSQPERARVGLTKFGLDGTNSWVLNTYGTKAPLQQAISDLPFGSEGMTVLANGMSVALEQYLDSSNGNRPDVDNVMLIITDGRDRSDVQEQQRRAVAAGVNVYAIGVGNRVDENQLALAAGSLAKVYLADSFDDLDPLVNQIIGGVFRQQFCLNGGSLVCFCTANFTGGLCETPKDLCQELPEDTCSGNGQCMYDPDRGSWCVCNQGWIGETCDQPDGETIFAGQRCWLKYDTGNINSNCTNGNNGMVFKCVPDDQNCYFVPCPEPQNIGWCTPDPEASAKRSPKKTKREANRPPKLPSQGDDNSCRNGGTGSCDCPSSHDGPRCETLFNWCNGGGDGVHNSEPCGVFGRCVYDTTTGSQCVCEPGWTGTYCSEPIEGEVYVSRRCWLQYGMGNPSANCTGTPVETRCIVDNLECAQMVCPEPDNIGWCIPITAMDTMLKEMRQMFAPKVLVYDDPAAVRFNNHPQKRK